MKKVRKNLLIVVLLIIGSFFSQSVFAQVKNNLTEREKIQEKIILGKIQFLKSLPMDKENHYHLVITLKEGYKTVPIENATYKEWNLDWVNYVFDDTTKYFQVAIHNQRLSWEWFELYDANVKSLGGTGVTEEMLMR